MPHLARPCQTLASQTRNRDQRLHANDQQRRHHNGFHFETPFIRFLLENPQSPDELALTLKHRVS
jgi:hypothetical protein